MFGARSLIESAELSSQIRQFHDIGTSVRAFKLEYGGIPGDFNEATDYWAAASNGDNSKTLNGSEGVYFWDHLERAEIYMASHPTGVTSSTAIESGIMDNTALWPGYGNNAYGFLLVVYPNL